MSAETNKAVVRRFFEEIINGTNPAAAAELFAPEYRLYFAGNPPMGAEEAAGFIGGVFRAAFPDLRDEVQELVAEGDRVAARGVTHGTHRGEFFGVPATGKTIAVSWISLMRLTPEGRIAESRVAFDQLGMMQQLGAIPAPDGAPTS
jgi:steroid delta-isomerase-like uncharacterized protein